MNVFKLGIRNRVKADLSPQKITRIQLKTNKLLLLNKKKLFLAPCSEATV